MSKPIIQVQDLSKSFITFKKSEGLLASVKDLFKRESTEVRAVKNVSFKIEEGDFVGFLGPNGAGKTTTLKMLTGILTPTSGEAKVLGYTPWKRKSAFKKQFALVMGQKSQLWWDLPPIDSYELFRHMYEIPEKQFKKTLNFLTDLLDISDIIQVQTRKMSLGQRMKAELVGALLHKPKVLFLDEPTIGLDVISQKAVRDFLREYNKETKATIILTSHYMEDIRKLCKRVMIINHGEILYDGTYTDLIQSYGQKKHIDLSFTEKVPQKTLKQFGEVSRYQGSSVRLHIDRKQTAKTLTNLMNKLPIEDVSVREHSLEKIIAELFTKK